MSYINFGRTSIPTATISTSLVKQLEPEPIESDPAKILKSMPVTTIEEPSPILTRAIDTIKAPTSTTTATTTTKVPVAPTPTPAPPPPVPVPSPSAPLPSAPATPSITPLPPAVIGGKKLPVLPLVLGGAGLLGLLLLTRRKK